MSRRAIALLAGAPGGGGGVDGTVLGLRAALGRYDWLVATVRRRGGRLDVDQAPSPCPP